MAAAIEILHLATLIHDDVIDNAAFRRNQPAFHTQHGSRNAVLIGDYLFATCFSLAADYPESTLVKNLSKVVLRLCNSELEQAHNRFSQQINIRQYLKQIAGKTAGLFAFSSYLGALETGCKPVLQKTLTKIGYSFGMSFQIIDDLFDYKINKKSIGKPIRQDLNQGIYTLPLIYALKKDSGKLSELLKLNNPDDEQLKKIVKWVYKLGGIPQARRLAHYYTARSIRELKKLPVHRARSDFKKCILHLLKRNY